MPDTDRPGERGTCSECGISYTPYLILVPDDFVALSEYAELTTEIGYVCQDCLGKVAPHLAATTDPTHTES